MEGTIGEVRIFGGNFAPRTWAFCAGQLVAISTQTALFSILGTTYGGDGRTTFGLPDLRGRVALGPGGGPGLSTYRPGERGGAEMVTLNVTQMPQHNHMASGRMKASSNPGGEDDPANNVPAVVQDGGRPVKTYTAYASAANAEMQEGGVEVQVGTVGGSQAHENRQPFLAMYYVICMMGIYPSRN